MKTSFFYTLLSFITILSSTIITIPEDYPTIQFGIDSAVDSDTILVNPGTYYEHIDYNGKNILIGSLFIIEHDTTYISQTIIDGYDSGTVVTFFNEEYSGAELSGFTITNGYADHLWGYDLGGGILIAGSADGTIPIPELNNLIIRDNYAEKGSGMFLGKACPKLWKIKLINNYASQTGGGIQMNSESNPLMIEIEIRDNYALWGAGLYCYDNSNPTLYRMSISNNEAVYEGGGILCYINCSPIIHNATITRNFANTGSGIFCNSNSDLTLINSIVWNNYYQEIYFSGGSDLTITYSDIANGWEGIGNIQANPLFVDAAQNDFHLLENSPCIDAGDPNSFDPDMTISDMGAFYYHHEPLFPPENITIEIVENMVMIRWEGDNRRSYNIYSSYDPALPYESWDPEAERIIQNHWSEPALEQAKFYYITTIRD